MTGSKRMAVAFATAGVLVLLATVVSPEPKQTQVATRVVPLDIPSVVTVTIPTTTTTVVTTTTTETTEPPTTAPSPRPVTTQPPEQPAVEQVDAVVVDYPASSYNTTGDINGYPCGGDLPPCFVLARESGGNPEAQNPSSTASGLWQFLDSTWAGFGGYSKARYAPVDVQNEKAMELWNGGAGCHHWSAC